MGMGICYNAINKGKTSLKTILNDESKYNNYSDTAFDKIDTDKNGYIEKDEVAKLVQELVNRLKKDTRIPEDKVKSVLELIDSDKDGRISKEEFRKTSRAKLLTVVAS